MKKIIDTLTQIIGGIIVIIFIVFLFSIWFYNHTKKLQIKLTNELENTKIIYSQCAIKIIENNREADLYRKDLEAISKQAGNNLQWFNKQLFSWFNTKIIPNVSPTVRINVQKIINSCRNQYLENINLNLKPLINKYNIYISTFPNNAYNLFYKFKKEEFKLPQNISVINSFKTWIDTPIDLK